MSLFAQGLLVLPCDILLEGLWCFYSATSRSYILIMLALARGSLVTRRLHARAVLFCLWMHFLAGMHIFASMHARLYVNSLCLCGSLYSQNKRRHRQCLMSDSVLSKTSFSLYLEKGNAQDLQTICCAIGCSKAPRPRWAPKAHHVENKTQETHCARSSGTNVLILEQTRDKFTSLLIVLQMHENELK